MKAFIDEEALLRNSDDDDDDDDDDTSVATTVKTTRGNPGPGDEDSQLVIVEPTSDLTSNDPNLPSKDPPASQAIPSASTPFMAKSKVTVIPVDLTLGRPCDYVPVLQIVDEWQFAPNPPGVTRLPYDGLESQIKTRLSSEDTRVLKDVAIRNGFYIFNHLK